MNAFDLAPIQSKLTDTNGRQYWRSLDELAKTTEFQEMFQREFPEGASEWCDDVSRRHFLKMAAASFALAGLSGCTKQPPKEILPYVNQPEGLILGEPLLYATALVHDGFATGVLVKSREGHPIKVEGNPEHPSSLGASSIWMQASLLDLYDPDRSRSVTHQGNISTWSFLLSDLNQLAREEIAREGSGLRFLTGTVTSPTLVWQLQDLLKRFPRAKWHQYDPINRDHVLAGARLAFGRPVEAHYRFDQAAVIVSLDSDFLYAHPEKLRYARQFADGRRIAAGKKGMNRLYVAESSPTVTGSMAEHRLPIASGEIGALLLSLVHQLGIELEQRPGELEPRSPRGQWLSRLAGDVQRNRGASLIIAGESQPPMVHALAHLLNERLGNVGQTVFYTEPAQANPGNQLESLSELSDDMRAGGVENLFILGGNPAYTAPVDFELPELFKNIKRLIHLGLDLNETAGLSTWHVPQAHDLESWSDARAFDGTVSILQPLILPLYNGKTPHELLSAIIYQQPMVSDYEIVHRHWRTQNRWNDFEKGWRRTLHDGLMAGTAYGPTSVRVKSDLVAGAITEFRKSMTASVAVAADLELNFRADPSVWDGRFANNGWLQECPRPISKLTWDNAALISPRLAERQKVTNGDLVELRFAGSVVRAPIWIMPGQAQDSVTIHLGYGRSQVGRVGSGIGFNAYRLRSAHAPWFGRGLKITRLGARHLLAATQTHHNIEGEERQIYRSGTLDEFLARPEFLREKIEVPASEETLYDPSEFPRAGYQWGMSIDLTTCIGCNACLLSCEAENNIPVVGKDQIARHREMFWIRVDTYFQGDVENPRFHHMPVPCMHCEHAPCELVCPVAATVHDHEGLNLQVYNRCVGTRFCSNNCPYKVRRFNFLQYANYEEPGYKALYNPEVTVRWRGVMEKCTYCIQRIRHARIRAEKENRPVRDGEIQTACQQACPAEAIQFGNLNDPASSVARLKKHPLDYPMLGQLNTRPRTTYLARVLNPNTSADI